MQTDSLNILEIPPPPLKIDKLRYACSRCLQGRTQNFSPGGTIAYMPKKVPNIRRIINNDILKVVNIVFYRGEVAPLPSRCVRPGMFRIVIKLKA